MFIKRFKSGLFLFIFSFSGVGAADNITLFIPVNGSQNGYIVPFTLNGGLIIVQARVNDSLVNFVIDTGAEGLVLNSRHFRGTEDGLRQFCGVSGRGESLRVSKNNRMLVDALVYENLSADVIDLSSIENQKSIKIAGLIGFSLLKEFEVMFNYRERFISLFRVDDKGNVIDPMPFMKNKADSLFFVFGNFIPVIDAKNKWYTQKIRIGFRRGNQPVGFKKIQKYHVRIYSHENHQPQWCRQQRERSPCRKVGETLHPGKIPMCSDGNHFDKHGQSEYHLPNKTGRHFGF
jgi:hypothetical protein